eukprot:jgi/Astpho2/4408/Aster-00026
MAPQQETWVVTGASRGLGLEHVKQFLKQGFTIVAAARSPSKSEALTKLHQEYKDKLTLISLDTADCKSVKAGVMCHYMDPAEYLKILDVNVVGPLRVTQALLPLLLKKNTRKVINISSTLGSISTHRKQEFGPMSSRFVAYNSSKAALNMQSAVLANSLKEDKVIVVALNPGWVDTDMGSAAGEEVGMKPPLNPPTSIAGQQRVIAGLKLEDSGRFVDFEKGGDIPY